MKPSEVGYYWPSFGKLVREAGGKPNGFNTRLSDDFVFREYARVCLHLGKIPTQKERCIAQREIKARTHTVDNRDGSIWEFRKKFRAWLSSPDDARLDFVAQCGNMNRHHITLSARGASFARSTHRATSQRQAPV